MPAYLGDFHMSEEVVLVAIDGRRERGYEVAVEVDLE